MLDASMVKWLLTHHHTTSHKQADNADASSVAVVVMPELLTVEEWDSTDIETMGTPEALGTEPWFRQRLAVLVKAGIVSPAVGEAREDALDAAEGS